MATVWAFIRATTKTKANVRFRVIGDNKETVFYTSELTIQPSHWDSKKQGVKTKVLFDADERADFNMAVEDLKLTLKKIAESTNEPLTSSWLKKQVDISLNPQKYDPNYIENKPQTLFGWIDKFIEEAPNRKDKVTGRLLSYNNIQQYKATHKHLKTFARIRKKRDFYFDEIDNKFYSKFVEYLQKPIPAIDDNGDPEFDDEGNPINLKESYTANSVGKHIRVLKLILNEATAAGINTSTAYNSFHVFTEDVDTIYLDEDDLQVLKNFDLSKTPHLDRVRDWFLLLAWTGCRFSDLEKVGKTDIKDGFITFRQQKTNTKVTIPLHPVVLEILEKYDYDLPEPITNQRFNEYIKEAAKAAGLNSQETITKTIGGKLQTSLHPKHELISSHTGRRSFCTNMYKRGLPTLMIMSISGHKTEKSFLKYIKVKQAEHAEMMAKKWAEIYK